MRKKYLIIGGVVLLIIVGIVILFILLFGCKKKTVVKPSYLVLENGTKFYIDTSGDFCTNRTYNNTFDFVDFDGMTHTIDREQITEIHLTDLQQKSLELPTTAPDNYLQYMCAYMINLKIVDINIPQSINVVGNHFCAAMFESCISLESLPDKFKLPQKLIYINDNFCTSMFYGCVNLVSLPDNFFYKESNEVRRIGNYFCYHMFQECTSISYLGKKFTLSFSNVSLIGNDFCYNMFWNYTSLNALPTNFNVPQKPETIGNYFCSRLFYKCSGLKNDSANSVTITIPNPSQSGNNFCTNMFYGCDGLNGVDASPTSSDTITINAN